MAPNISLDVGKPIPAGYVVGRLNGGVGDAQLISISDLAGQIAVSGYVMPAGSSSSVPTGPANEIAKSNGSTLVYTVHLTEDGTSVTSDLPFISVGSGGAVGTFAAHTFSGAGAGTATAALFQGVSARGSVGSPSAVHSGDYLGGIYSGAYDGTDYTLASEAAGNVRFEASENWTEAAHGTRARLAVVKNGTINPEVEVLTAENDGGVVVPSAATGGSKGAGTINVSGGYYINGANIQGAQGFNGLFAGDMSAKPTQAGTGLTSTLGITTATVADSAVGITITAPLIGSDHIEGIYKAAPATPYSVIALFVNNAPIAGNGLAGIGWYSNTSGKLHVIDINHLQYEVTKWNSNTSFNGSDVTLSSAAIFKMLWVKLKDDGTNVSFSISYDGVGWVQLFSVAKASGFLGSTGYQNIIFFCDPNGNAVIGSLLSYTETSP